MTPEQAARLATLRAKRDGLPPPAEAPVEAPREMERFDSGLMRAPPLAEPVPEGDLRGAEDRYFETRSEYLAPEMGITQARQRALEDLQRIEGVPRPIPEEPSYFEQFLRTVLPKVITEDNRPVSTMDRAKAFVAGAAGAATSTHVTAPMKPISDEIQRRLGVTPLTVRESFFGVEDADEKKRADAMIDPDTYGMRSENEVMWILRLIGTTASALVQETGFRSVGDWLLGTTPELRGQRVQRDNPVGDYFQGVMEKIERGSGLEEDLMAVAKAQFGDTGGGKELQQMAWWAGLIADTFTNWEGIAAKGPRAALRVKRQLEVIEKMLPPGMKPTLSEKAGHIVNLLMKPEIHMGEAAARQTADALVSGRASLRDMDPEFQETVAQIAVNQHGRTPREVMDEDGLDVSDLPEDVDEEFVRMRDELQAASAPTKEPAPPPKPIDGPRLFLATMLHELQSGVDGFTGDDAAWVRRWITHGGISENGTGLPSLDPRAQAMKTRVATMIGHHIADSIEDALAKDIPVYAVFSHGTRERIRGLSEPEPTGETPGQGIFIRQPLFEDGNRLSPYSVLRGNARIEFGEPSAAAVPEPKAPEVPAELDPSIPAENLIPSGYKTGVGKRKSEYVLNRDGTTKHKRSKNAKPSERTVFVSPTDAAELAEHFKKGGSVFAEGKALSLDEEKGYLVLVVKGPGGFVLPTGKKARTMPMQYSPAPKTGLVPIEFSNGSPYKWNPNAGEKQDYAHFAAAKTDRGIITELVTPNPNFAPRPPRKKGVAPESPRPVRPNLPTPTHPFQTAAEWSKWAGEMQQPENGGFQRNRHAGFRGMQELVPGQSPETLGYTVRDEHGGVVGTPSHVNLAQALDRLAERGYDNETVWFGNRPVAHWKKRGTLEVASDWTFASPDETAIIHLLREKDPRFRPGTLRQRAKADVPKDAPDPHKPSATPRMIGTVLHDALADSPHARSLLPPPKTRSAQMFEEAGKLMFRRRFHTDQFVPVFGVLIPKNEAKVLLEQVEEIYSQFSDGRAPLPKEFGETLAGRESEVRRLIVRELAPVLSDARYALQGTPFLAYKIRDALATFGGERGRVHATNAKVQAAMRVALNPLFEDRLAKTAPHVRNAFETARQRASHVGEDVYRKIERGKKALQTDDPMPVLGMMTREWGIVTPSELRLADDILNRPDRTPEEWLRLMTEEAEHAPKLAKELERRVGEAIAEGSTSEMPFISEMMVRWATSIQRKVDELADLWLQSHFIATRGPSFKKTAQLQALSTDVKPATKRAVYKEIFHDPNPADGNNPATRQAYVDANIAPTFFEKVAGKTPDTSKSREAFVAMILKFETNKVVNRLIDELLDADVAVRINDDRAPAIRAMIENTHTKTDDQGRLRFKYPEATMVWARERLSSWGIEPGSKAEFSEARAGGRRVLLPPHLAEEFRRLDTLGMIDSRAILRGLPGSDAINKIYRWYKISLMQGIGPFIKPARFVGQMMAFLPTRYVTGGMEGVRGTVSAAFRHAKLTAELMKRLGANPDAPGDWVDPTLRFQTPMGPKTIDEMVDDLRRHGNQDTEVRFEGAEQLSDLLNRGKGPKLWRNIKAGAVWWQDLLATVAGSFDQLGRVGTYLDALEKGASGDQAAAIAKKAFFDFSALTDFEANYMRFIFTFYAFMRKNMDAHLLALLTHPERVTVPARLASASLESQGLTEEQLGAMRDNDTGRFTIDLSQPVYDRHGRLSPAYRQNRMQTTPQSVAEWANQVIQLKDFMSGDPEDLVSGMSPVITTGSIFLNVDEAMFGKKWGFGYDDANRVPPYLMWPGLGEMTKRLFDVEYEPTSDPAKAEVSASLAAGRPAFWVAKNRKAWQTFKVWMGGLDSNVQRMHRAGTAALRKTGVEPGRFGANPKPNMADAQAMWAMLADINPVETPYVAKKKADLQQEHDVEDATKELRTR